VTVDRAKIWSRPEQPPALIAPAVTVATAKAAADWADGLVTINQPHDHLREMVTAYRDAGGRGKLVLQHHLSYDPDPDRALETAFDQWHSNVFPPPLAWDLDTPEAFEAASAHVTPEVVAGAVRVSSDLAQHAAWIQEYVDLGFEEIYLHHVGTEQRGFLDAFGEHVLPQLGVTAPAPSVAL
jgi:alkanesulfonate monooxygenase SsuD/methylene tetrahydromethanopterin reductase-like flavin-dependent oxidoreductase (luciferase family)